jgi:hypothetical protein
MEVSLASAGGEPVVILGTQPPRYSAETALNGTKGCAEAFLFLLYNCLLFFNSSLYLLWSL